MWGQVLFLHDLTNRKRFLTALDKVFVEEVSPNSLDHYEAQKKNLLAKIDRLCVDLGIPEEQGMKLKDGQRVYIDGLRGAVREAGLDVHKFDFFHTYLSNHVHSHPVSILRTQEHGISFEEPSAFQLNLCAQCLNVATEYLTPLNKRISTFTGEICRDPVGPLE